MINKDNLKNLLSITSIDQDLKTQFLTLIETASEEKLLEIESCCWTTLLADAQQKKLKLASEYRLKAEKGRVPYSWQ